MKTFLIYCVKKGLGRTIATEIDSAHRCDKGVTIYNQYDKRNLRKRN